jgi:tetratricopeptide (TPR) repeat protein
MSGGGWMSARLNEIEEVDDGRCPYRAVRLHFGINAFGVNGWVARDAGDRLINEHDEDEEDGNEELYVVTVGRATFELDGEKVDAPEGTLVFVKPEVKRTAFAEEAGTTLLAIGGVAGKAYEASGWELWAPAQALYQSGDYEGVIERMKPVVDEHPEYAGLIYNLACAESLAGRSEDAIGHLRRAIELRPSFRSFARGDTDFDPIKEDPAFQELVGEQ